VGEVYYIKAQPKPNLWKLWYHIGLLNGINDKLLDFNINGNFKNL